MSHAACACDQLFVDFGYLLPPRSRNTRLTPLTTLDRGPSSYKTSADSKHLRPLPGCDSTELTLRLSISDRRYEQCFKPGITPICEAAAPGQQPSEDVSFLGDRSLQKIEDEGPLLHRLTIQATCSRRLRSSARRCRSSARNAPEFPMIGGVQLT